MSALLEMIEGFRKPLLTSARKPGSNIKEEDMVKLFGNAETILRWEGAMECMGACDRVVVWVYVSISVWCM